MIRRIVTYLVMLLLLLSQIQVKAQIAFSFMLGPNYSYFIQSRSDYAAEASPGVGIEAGLQFKAGDNHLLSFKTYIGYSLQTPHIKLPDFYHSWSLNTFIEGNYNLSNILIHPQVQFNFLKNKTLFLGIGPFCQVRVAETGSGTFNYGWGTYDFTNNHAMPIKMIFNKWNYGPGISFGYQKIPVGKMCLFFELRELWMINNYFNDDDQNNVWQPKATWYNLMTSLSVGIDFYRSK